MPPTLSQLCWTSPPTAAAGTDSTPGRIHQRRPPATIGVDVMRDFFVHFSVRFLYMTL